MDRKGLGFIQTEFPAPSGDSMKPATLEDLVPYNGPVIFDVNQNTSEALVRIKEDNVTEDESVSNLCH